MTRFDINILELENMDFEIISFIEVFEKRVHVWAFKILNAPVIGSGYQLQARNAWFVKTDFFPSPPKIKNILVMKILG
jgi:hypothetical protein